MAFYSPPTPDNARKREIQIASRCPTYTAQLANPTTETQANYKCQHIIAASGASTIRFVYANWTNSSNNIVDGISAVNNLSSSALTSGSTVVKYQGSVPAVTGMLLSDVNIPTNTTIVSVQSGTTASGVATTDIFTAVGHGYASGTVVAMSVLTGLAGISSGSYFIKSATANTFQLSVTNGGVALNFTSNGNCVLDAGYTMSAAATGTAVRTVSATTLLGTMTLTAACEYKNIIYPMTFNGRSSVVIEPGGGPVATDPIGINIPTSRKAVAVGNSLTSAFTCHHGITAVADSAVSNTVFTAVDHRLSNGAPVGVLIDTGITGLPSGTYFIVGATDDTFQLALSAQSAPVTFTTTGAGACTVDGLAEGQWMRLEFSSGLAGLVSGIYYAVNVTATSFQVAAVPSTAPVTFTTDGTAVAHVCQSIYSRQYISVTGGAHPRGNTCLAGRGEGAEVGTSITNKALSGTITPSSSTAMYTPCAILGTPANGDYGSVVVLLDSLGAGNGAAVSTADRGFADKACAGIYGCANLAVSGGTGSGWMSPGDTRFRRSLLRLIQPSMVLAGCAGNDLNLAGATSAGIQVTLERMWDQLKIMSGAVIVGWTIPPRTTSSDSWRTLAGQTVNSPNSDWENQRSIQNAFIQSGGNGRLAGYVRFSETVADETEPSKWKVTGNNNAYTSDGAHPNDTGLPNAQQVIANTVPIHLAAAVNLN